MTCPTWSNTTDKPITGLCSMEMLRETERKMRYACPICVTPVAVVGPTGCCLCPSDEQFPGIWEFASAFSASGAYSVTSPRTWTGTACLARVEPTGDGYATVTRNIYRPAPSEYVPLPLIRTLQNPIAGVPQPVCGWTNGSGRIDGWYWQASHKSAGCGLLPGFASLRCSYNFNGAFVNPNGTTTGGGYGASSCLWSPSKFFWANVPEFPGREGTPMTGDLWYDFLTCTSYPANVRPKQLFAPQVCWQWHLTCNTFLSGASNTVRLYLSAAGYSYAYLDRIIYVDGVFGAIPRHDEITTVNGGGNFCFFEPDGTTGPGYLATQGTSSIVWEGVYPCNEPRVITLTTATPSPIAGLFKGLTFPTVIKLRAVY